MTTKHSLSYKGKQDFAIIDDTTNDQNINLNLNQNYSLNAFCEPPKNFEKKKAFNYDFTNYNNSQMKKYSNSWNKSTANLLSSNLVKNDYGLKTSDELKNSNSISSSTLSLHIEAYENMIETSTDLFDGTKENLKQNKNGLIKHKKQIFANLTTPVIKTLFEFPRQQESNQTKMPKISQYKASQQLLNSNQINSRSLSDHPGDSNTSRNHSRSSSVSSVNRINPKLEENEPFVDPLFAESVPPADPLALLPMTEEEYDAIYTEETRAKAIVLLIYFSILMVALPFASMYYCYHYVFNEYDASTDMLYSGLVAIAEVYILVAIFIFIAYKDEQTIEKRIKTKND